MSWLVRERPDVRCDYAINEGGGSLLELADGRKVVTIAIGREADHLDAAAGQGQGGSRLGPGRGR